MRDLFVNHFKLIGIDYLIYKYLVCIVTMLISVIFFSIIYFSINSASKFSINPLTMFICALVIILVFLVIKYQERIKLIDDLKNNGIKDNGLIISYKNWPRDQLICIINIGSINKSVEIILHVTRKNKKRLLEYFSAGKEISVLYGLQERIKCILIDFYK